MFYSYFERKIDKGLKFKIDVFANIEKKCYPILSAALD